MNILTHIFHCLLEIILKMPNRHLKCNVPVVVNLQECPPPSKITSFVIMPLEILLTLNLDLLNSIHTAEGNCASYSPKP